MIKLKSKVSFAENRPIDTNIFQINQNAMELLVAEEIERQIDRYPAKLTKYINKLEVATYALNRLPPLYASSEEGLEWQKKRARREFKKQIECAVRQGFATVHKDPLRISTPLISAEDREVKDVKLALQDLANLVPQKEFSWLIKFVKQVLTKIANREMTEEAINQLYYQLCFDWTDYRYR